jgi:SNF2 family DNA or RNA helicase
LVARETIQERIVSLHRTKRELAGSSLAESDQATRLCSSERRALFDLGVV